MADVEPPGELGTTAGLKTKEDPPAGRAPAVIVTIVIATIVGLSLWYLSRPEPLLVQGEADSTRVDIAARVDGRVTGLPAVRGQDVQSGAVLVEIDNPELLARRDEAVAAKAVAEAELARINAGTRSETVAVRKAEIDRAQDAHEALTVAVRADTLAEAQRALFDRRVFAIVDIPVDTERDVLKGDAARLPAYVNSTYMMLYNRTWQGVSDAADAVAADVVSHGARADGNLYRAALAAISPVELLMAPLFNPTGGYANYVVPAAFVLILQQTLLMGSAMLTSGGATVSRRPPGLFNTMAMPLGRAIAHLTLYLAPLGLFLVVLPRVYGFSTLGRPLDLFLFAVPFILATSLMGQTAGAWFRRRETAVVLFIATTLPQFFLVGVSWPAESIPPALRAAGRVFPERVRHRWAGADQPDGREPERGQARLDGPVGACRRVPGPFRSVRALRRRSRASRWRLVRAVVVRW